MLEYFEENLSKLIKPFINENVEEIRLRVNKPIVLKTNTSKKLLNHLVTTEEILKTFEKVCENSVYSYKRQICEGFITIKNGHRVGIAGNCAFENGQVINVNYISSLNFRIAHEIKGCSDNIFKYIESSASKCIFNTLIASKPGCGKTTILRDLIRKISNRRENMWSCR